MSKRKFDLDQELNTQKFKKLHSNRGNLKQHTLDSDEEEDRGDKDDVLDADDIEGEEEGVSRQQEGIPMTAFNMSEEMEEGHFDKQGHFIWNNEKEIRDNWLDNIDWQKIKNPNEQYNLDSNEIGLGEESDSESDEKFDEVRDYKEMLKYMKPGENVNQSVRRLGGDNRQLSSVERLKRKKAGTLAINKDVTTLTGLANNILTNMGNMDVYQETYEQIEKKVEKSARSSKMESDFDMFSDDFGNKQKKEIPSSPTTEEREVMWEYKLDQNSDSIDGPHTTLQMHKWVREGKFKAGAWVRRCGENSNFYSSNRIDFDLYL